MIIFYKGCVVSLSYTLVLKTTVFLYFPFHINVLYLIFCSRGNAVIRPTAKKHPSQDIEVPMNTDSIMDVDSTWTVPARTSKSKTKIVIQRFVRTFRMLTIIAAVNLPLYVMLLFKDWID